MQAAASYAPWDCQTYSGFKKRNRTKNLPQKNMLTTHFFEQISNSVTLSVVERQLTCRYIINTT